LLHSRESAGETCCSQSERLAMPLEINSAESQKTQSAHHCINFVRCNK
jgi:hypothetical protein